jgi:uncharacterized membrane protein YcaP (DUF421 family)
VAVIPVVRAVAMYGFILVLLRVMGKRSLAQVTTFDFIVLLIISETTQQAMTGNDFSFTNAAILVLTLMLLQRGADLLANRSKRADKLLNDLPIVIVEDGRPLDEWMRRNGITQEEVLEEARRNQGVERLEDIRYAVLERNGGISVIPRS